MFDPNKPADHSPLSSAEMRSQLQGLKAIIDAILTVTAAQIDGVNTVNPGDPADVSVSVVGNTLHFTFDLPRGNDGAQGPPFADAIVDAVNTLNPGDPASVSVSFDGTNVHFTFNIPRGDQGDPGEVTQAQLDSAIAGTSSNTNGVSTLDSAFGDPDAETLRQKLNEVILNGRR